MSIFGWILLGVVFFAGLWIVLFWWFGREEHLHGEGRFSTTIPPLDLAPFGTLKWTRNDCWETKIRLPVWTAFRLPTGDSVKPHSPADSSITVTVIPHDPKRDRTPSEAQRKAFHYQIDHGTEVVSAILGALPKYYRDLREDWGVDAKDMPEITEPEKFRSLIGPPQLIVHPVVKDGTAYIGLLFGCEWDPEHDFGVMLHGSRIVGLGDHDAASANQRPDEAQDP
jgi:hypothetical protein